MATKTLLTLAEFEQMPVEEGLRFELDEGELVSMTFPNPRHNRVAGEIFTYLKTFVRSGSLGQVYPSDTGYLLSRDPDVLRGPDVSFVRRDRMALIDEERNIEGAPDLAVEVVSPSDKAQDLNRKVQQYLRAGTHTVWMVYPKTRQVEVIEAKGTARFVEADEKLEAPVLLPGFSVFPRDFFDAA